MRLIFLFFSGLLLASCHSALHLKETVSAHQYPEIKLTLSKKEVTAAYRDSLVTSMMAVAKVFNKESHAFKVLIADEPVAPYMEVEVSRFRLLSDNYLAVATAYNIGIMVAQVGYIMVSGKPLFVPALYLPQDKIRSTFRLSSDIGSEPDKSVKFSTAIFRPFKPKDKRFELLRVDFENILYDRLLELDAQYKENTSH